MPNRIIRHGFLDSDKINSLPEKEQNFFVRLMLIVDDYGRYDARPKLISSMCYPVSDIGQSTVSKMLSTLKNKELIELYSVKGKNYLQIVEFNQRLRQKKEKYPGPMLSDDSHVSDKCQTDVGLKRRELETENELEKKKNPETISDFDNALLKFEKMRKRIRKPLTDDGKDLIINKLKELSSDETTQIDILNQSTMNSWQGVFPLKEVQEINNAIKPKKSAWGKFG